jgi:hypothetical protein
MKEAPKILKEQMKWRKTDLNPDSPRHFGHLRRIAILKAKYNSLKKSYDIICGDDCP